MAGLMLTFRANPAHLQAAELERGRGTDPTTTQEAAQETAQETTPHVTPQVTPHVTPQVTPQVERLLIALQGEMDRETLQAALHLKARKSFRERYLKPAQEAGLIHMTIPDKPNSRLQRYRLTIAGEAYLATLRQKDDPHE